MFRRGVFIVCILCAFNIIIGKSIDGFDGNNDRPPYREYAKMARYLVHKSNWTSMGTISSVPLIRGSPMVNVISIADSALNAPSTGNIYFLLTDLDFTAQDLNKNNTLTTLFTEDQDLACTERGTDSMEPTCARVIITGKAKRLDPTSAEHARADEWYTNRHPASVHWRKSHLFYFCKLDIEHIAVLDFYGGPHFVSTDDYYNANYDSAENVQENDINTRWPSVVTPKQA